ncbi:hypothetical protein HRbin15_02621 [bacterium HR15]|nr:hypothetical protein HRbin15_02621 [bacterium HR15]
MTCWQFKRLLWSYVEGTVGAAEQQACEAHLARCARCRHQLQAAQLTRRALQSLPRHSAPVHLLERVRAEIPASCADETVAAVHQAPRATRPLLLPARLWRWALAPALGVLVALLWWWSQSTTPLMNKQAREPQTQQASQEYADTCIEVHQQLEMAEWAGTPAASYLITTGYTR